MIGKSTARTRLCPYCANSIDEDATECRYCKSDFSSGSTPQWLKRDETSSEPRVRTEHHKRFPIPPKFIWPAATLVAVLIAFVTGSYLQRNELSLLSQANQKQLQTRDQMIQSQETQLAQTRQQLNENAAQLAEMKTKLGESEKELAQTQQRLVAATRQIDRLNTSGSMAPRRTASRAPDTAPLPQPVGSRRSAAPGVYETTRATAVYEDPSSNSRVISQISGGTRINVVGSNGGWLEVRSKHGNPPGYVRSDDARQVSAVN